eukprot:scaffold1280_cov379-Prasinococcus_capsulatus_cf.AAC.14
MGRRRRLPPGAGSHGADPITESGQLKLVKRDHKNILIPPNLNIGVSWLPAARHGTFLRLRSDAGIARQHERDSSGPRTRRFQRGGGEQDARVRDESELTPDRFQQGAKRTSRGTASAARGNMPLERPDPEVECKQRLKDLMQLRDAKETELEALVSGLQATPVGVDGPLVDADGFPYPDVDVFQVRRDRNRVSGQAALHLDVLRTDLKEIQKQLEQGLHELHAMARGAAAPRPPSSSAQSLEPGAIGVMSDPVQFSRGPPAAENGSTVSVSHGTAIGGTWWHFVMCRCRRAEATCIVCGPLQKPKLLGIIDSITEGSPAADDGLKIDDGLIRFGRVVRAGQDREPGQYLQQVAHELRAMEGRPVEVEVFREGRRHRLTLTPRSWAGQGLLGCHLQPTVD